MADTLGDLFLKSYDTIRGEEAEKILRKGLQESGKEKAKTPEGQQELLGALIKSKVNELQQDNIESDGQSQSKEKSSGSKDLISRLLMSVGSAMAAYGGNTELGPALLKMYEDKTSTKITPQSQMTILKETQQLMKESGIKGTVGVTATGAPTVSVSPEMGISDLAAEQQIQAIDLARRTAGVRGMKDALPSIAERLRQGETIDKIEDDLRLSQQSEGFSGNIREAAQQLTIGQSKTTANRTFDSLDDLIDKGDKEGAKSFLKRIAIKSTTADEANQVNGKERTIEFLGEIENDLAKMEAKGISTGLFSGTREQMMAKIGRVKDPEMRAVTTKISLAVMKFRRAMTGVQFGMKEHAEYAKVFPSISKVGEFNTATIGALKQAFTGDLDRFYSLSMGEDNYQKLFKTDSGNDVDILGKLGLDPNKYEIVR